jgi:hypothetical protein
MIVLLNLLVTGLIFFFGWNLFELGNNILHMLDLCKRNWLDYLNLCKDFLNLLMTAIVIAAICIVIYGLEHQQP